MKRRADLTRLVAALGLVTGGVAQWLGWAGPGHFEACVLMALGIMVMDGWKS